MTMTHIDNVHAFATAGANILRASGADLDMALKDLDQSTELQIWDMNAGLIREAALMLKPFHVPSLSVHETLRTIAERYDKWSELTKPIPGDR